MLHMHCISVARLFYIQVPLYTTLAHYLLVLIGISCELLGNLERVSVVFNCTSYSGRHTTFSITDACNM